jgi:UDP-glucose 4-epimerase
MWLHQRFGTGGALDWDEFGSARRSRFARPHRGGCSTVVGMKVLVTGGAGYIGSITAAALEQAGHVPIVLDSLLSGPAAFTAGRVFYRGDVADRQLLEHIVGEHPEIGCTIHMAARIVVTESVTMPYAYYHDNVAKSLELFDQLRRLGRPRIVFSSSASVYAATDDFEVVEDSPTAPQSPYARTKLIMEMVLQDLARAGDLQAVILRYFNPIGSDPQLRYGMYVREPSHVLGQLVLAAQGRRDAFEITGTDYPTRDGTGLRDYVHVWDLARAHVAAVQRFDDALDHAGAPSAVINLGTGRGVTVRELVAAVEQVLGQPVPVREAPRRDGDAVGAFANVDRARSWLGWSAELGLQEAVASAFAFAARRRELLGYP